MKQFTPKSMLMLVMLISAMSIKAVDLTALLNNEVKLSAGNNISIPLPALNKDNTGATLYEFTPTEGPITQLNQDDKTLRFFILRSNAIDGKDPRGTPVKIDGFTIYVLSPVAFTQFSKGKDFIVPDQYGGQGKGPGYIYAALTYKINGAAVQDGGKSIKASLTPEGTLILDDQDKKASTVPLGCLAIGSEILIQPAKKV